MSNQKVNLTHVASYYWQAFATLNNARQLGANGASPISLDEISNYCHLFSIRDTHERILLVRFIQSLDREFMKHYASK